MQDKDEKPLERYKLFLLGLMAGFTISITIILYSGELIMPKVMSTITSVVFTTTSLYCIYCADRIDK